MIKSPCGESCLNCGTVHTRCDKYHNFRKAKDAENELIRLNKKKEWDANAVIYESIEKKSSKR